MTNQEWAGWAQAGMGALAVLAAIWAVVQQTNKERDNRIIDDASFASYIAAYLDDVADRVRKLIEVPKDIRKRRELVDISNRLLEAYKAQVMDRIKKLVELPLTDWPDVEFANAFYDFYLELSSDLKGLEQNAQDVLHRQVIEEADRRKQEQVAADARDLDDKSEREYLEDAAEAYLGDEDDGKTVYLPPRGQRANFAATHSDRVDDEGFGFSDRVRDRQAYNKYVKDYLETEEQLGDWQSNQEALDYLEQTIVKPLTEISNRWREDPTDAKKPSLLRQAVDRYIGRAKRYHLAETYAERALRARRKSRIFA